VTFNTHRTNPEKLTRFDADFYNSLSDDDCIVCLTEKQIYILGQTLEQITWVRTRWTGDTSALDVDEISSQIQYRLAERMTCETLTTILQSIESITAQLDAIQQQVFEQDNTIDVKTTTLEDIFPPLEQSSEILAQPDTCDTEGKDAIYGACKAIVEFIHQNNLDFLESISQAGNFTDQAKRILSGIPLVGILPSDEVADYMTFIIDELLEEYNATVTEELLQTVICDLFCIAVDSDCSLDFAELLNYFSAKVDPSLSSAVTTFLNLVQFAIVGTFAGDDYFYYLCYFQLWLAYADSEFFGNVGIQSLAMTAAAGYNSPDSDWSIFCTDCPPAPFTPEIAENCLFTTPVYGTIIGEQSAGVWRVQSTTRPEGDQVLHLSDTEGRAFIITNAAHVSGVTIFSFTRYVDPNCTQEQGFGIGGGVPVRSYVAAQGGTTAFVYDLTIELA